MKEQAEDFMELGYYQATRRLLDGLVSELRVATVHLPLATYPGAIKRAARLLDEDRPDEARRVLEAALNTLVIEERAVPLPIINAQAMVEEAEDVLAEGERDRAMALLADARRQLELAEALGYGRRDGEYEELDKTLRALQDAIEEREDTEAALQAFRERLQLFRERIAS